MMYYSTKAMESAITEIGDLIEKIATIPGKYLSYNDARSLNNYLVKMQEELEFEINEVHINMTGITVEKWKEFNPGVRFRKRWAKDTKGAFGKEGNSVFDSALDCIVVKVEKTKLDYVLWIVEP